MSSKYGINTDDGFAVLLETTYYNKGGCHGKTESYGRPSQEYKDWYLSLSPRDALANALKSVLKSEDLYDSYARNKIVMIARKYDIYEGVFMLDSNYKDELEKAYLAKKEDDINTVGDFCQLYDGKLTIQEIADLLKLFNGCASMSQRVRGTSSFKLKNGKFL